MGLFSWLLGGIKDFLGGMISEFFNWLVECVPSASSPLKIRLFTSPSTAVRIFATPSPNCVQRLFPESPPPGSM